ncbi:hypothetical protein [Streptomyces sp. NPDC093225]|uniref:hypothetical protein n=1 Tax=Streptomyces sp. NPDC093225 TaxID=3366034 RepID=UPI003809C8A1
MTGESPVLWGLAANPALPPELFGPLLAAATPGNSWLAYQLADRDDLTRPQVLALAAFLDDGDTVAQCLARRGLLTAEDIDPAVRPDTALALMDEWGSRTAWARVLVADPSVERRERLAECRGLPDDVVDLLAADRDACVVTKLALSAPPERAPLLARLARYPHAEVRSAVAANPATPPAVLADLLLGRGAAPAERCMACDETDAGRYHQPDCGAPGADPGWRDCTDGAHESAAADLCVQALGNPALPADAAARFVGHPGYLVRRALAGREDLPQRAYEDLADAPESWVRGDLAANPAIAEPLLRRLARDADPDVRRDAARHPRIPLDALGPLVATTRIGSTVLPRIAAATADEVALLAAHRDPLLRMLVAARGDLPGPVRDALVADPDPKVAKSAARHPGLSEAQLRAALDRHGVQVAARIAGNPETPPELLEALAAYAPPVNKARREVARHPRATAAALRTCIAYDDTRRLAAAHPALAVGDLLPLLDHPDAVTVEAAARNPALPPATMRTLLP